jgi:hypothetical protein
MRRWLRPLWIVVALLFLLEAWLWDHLRPVVGFLVGLIAWDRLKARLKLAIEHLPPWATLVVFVIPFAVLFPLKIAEVYFLAQRQWIAAGAVLLLAKLLGLGVTAFIFDATRDKLLQMPWFRSLYDRVMWLRDWAHAQVEPIRSRIRSYFWLMQPHRAGRFFRRLARLRRRMQRA